MGDVVSIEVDGELGPPSFDGERRPPRWGMPVARVLVVGLVVSLGLTLGRSGATSQPQPTSTTESPTPSTTAVPSTTSTTLAQPDPAESARAALEAWGRFAGSGDLADLEGFFAVDGAQLAQLRQEAPTIVPGEPYEVNLDGATVAENAGTMTIVGDVSWTRAGEPVQQYRWSMDLSLGAAHWEIETIRTASTARGQSTDRP